MNSKTKIGTAQNDDDIYSQNYQDHCETISKLSRGDILRYLDYINALANYIGKENEVLDTISDIAEPFDKNISELSIVDIVRAADYMNLLEQFVDHENKLLDDFDTIIKPFNDIIEKLQVNELCRHQNCECYLFKSDLPQYDFVCPVCDENF